MNPGDLITGMAGLFISGSLDYGANADNFVGHASVASCDCSSDYCDLIEH